MFLPRPISIANSNDEAPYKRPYSIFDVGSRANFLSIQVFRQTRNSLITRRT